MRGSSDLARGRLEQAQDGAPGGRLATAALAHQAQGLALFDVKADPVHRLDIANRPAHQTTGDRKVLFEILDLEQDVVGFHVGHGLLPHRYR
jgi:hypothetical protein